MNLLIEEFDYLDSAGLFARVAQRDWSIFLDSGIINGQAPVTKHADFDVLAIKPSATLVTQGEATVVTQGTQKTTLSGDPLTVLQDVLSDLDFKLVSRAGQAVPAYVPGALGYFSYDLARRYEVIPELALDEERLPEMAIGIYACIVLVDHRDKKTLLVSMYDTANEEQISELQAQWRQLIELQIKEPNSASNQQLNKLASTRLLENMTQLDYRNRFNKVRDYIVEGDCYQVNLAKQFSTSVSGDCWQTYDYLRQLSPAPYGAYLNLPFAQVLSNSPESFIQCRDHKVVTSPIKGTRPRFHEDASRDKEMAKQLFDSAKDRAENLMIVDLMRNDLSISCELGSVAVPKLFALHSFANVHHLISTITGTLKTGLHALDLLRNCFPGGSITGAPKIQAMHIIEELEPNRRGLYCGAIAYVGADGNMETNIAIRTIVIKDGIARYSAGGGLVIDSDSDEEYQEIVDKAKMMTEALFD